MKNKLVSILIILAIFIGSGALMFGQSYKTIYRNSENSSISYRIDFLAYGSSLARFSPTGHTYVRWTKIDSSKTFNAKETFTYGFAMGGKIRDDSDKVAEYSLSVYVDKKIYNRTVDNLKLWMESDLDYFIGAVDCITFAVDIAEEIPNFDEGVRSLWGSYSSDEYNVPVGFLKYIIANNN